MNNPFLNPGKVVTNFSKVVEYLNTDECGFNNILNSNICTIDSSFTGASFGFTFKEVCQKQIEFPSKIIKKLISNLPEQNSITEFKNFIYK